MLTLTFVRPNELVAPLNINDSFYNMTNQQTEHHKHNKRVDIRHGNGAGRV